jgi:hypothetical protein
MGWNLEITIVELAKIAKSEYWQFSGDSRAIRRRAVLAGIPGKSSTQTGFGALTYTTSRPPVCSELDWGREWSPHDRLSGAIRVLSRGPATYLGTQNRALAVHRISKGIANECTENRAILESTAETPSQVAPQQRTPVPALSFECCRTNVLRCPTKKTVRLRWP